MKTISSFNPYAPETDMNGEVPILDKDYDMLGSDFLPGRPALKNIGAII